MATGLRAIFLMALAMGIGVFPANPTTICSMTLERCCMGNECGHGELDCCDSDAGDCCIEVLSGDALVLLPGQEPFPEVACSEIEFSRERCPGACGGALARADSPDPPPPLSVGERLVRFEIRLV